MGNVVGTILWDRTNAERKKLIHAKLDELSRSHGLMLSDINYIGYASDKDRYGVDIAGFKLIWHGMGGAKTKIGSFLKEASDMLKKERVTGIKIEMETLYI